MANPCVYKRSGGVWVMVSTCGDAGKGGTCPAIPNSRAKGANGVLQPIHLGEKDSAFQTAFGASLGLGTHFAFTLGDVLLLSCDADAEKTGMLVPQAGDAVHFRLTPSADANSIPTVQELHTNS